MSSVNNTNISWEEIIKMSRTELSKIPQKETLISLFIEKAPAVQENLSLLTKLVFLIDDTTSDSTLQKVQQTFANIRNLKGKLFIFKPAKDHLNFTPEILEGHTPLTFACHFCDLETIKKLAKTHNLNEANSRDDRTPLMVACGMNRNKVVDFLLDKKVDTTLRDKHECTALDYACQFGCLHAVERLVTKEYINLSGQGAALLHIACLNNQPKIVEYLLSLGAEFPESTPLELIENILPHFLKKFSSNSLSVTDKIKLINPFFKHGKHSKIRSIFLETACLNNQPKIVESLLNLGAEFLESTDPSIIQPFLSHLLDRHSKEQWDIIDKIKLINPLYKYEQHLKLTGLADLLYEIYAEYYSGAVKNKADLLCKTLSSEKDDKKLQEVIDSSKAFLDQLPMVFQFLAQLLGACPDDLKKLRGQVSSALEGVRRRLVTLNIDPKEGLMVEFSKKDIYHILLEWRIGGQPGALAPQDPAQQSVVDSMLDEPYQDKLGVTRQELGASEIDSGEALMDKVGIDNELEILITLKSSKEELLSAIDKKIEKDKREDNELKKVRDRLKKEGLSDSLCKEIKEAERGFNIALLKDHLAKKKNG